MRMRMTVIRTRGRITVVAIARRIRVPSSSPGVAVFSAVVTTGISTTAAVSSSAAGLAGLFGAACAGDGAGLEDADAEEVSGLDAELGKGDGLARVARVEVEDVADGVAAGVGQVDHGAGHLHVDAPVEVGLAAHGLEHLPDGGVGPKVHLGLVGREAAAVKVCAPVQAAVRREHPQQGRAQLVAVDLEPGHHRRHPWAAGLQVSGLITTKALASVLGPGCRPPPLVGPQLLLLNWFDPPFFFAAMNFIHNISHLFSKKKEEEKEKEVRERNE